jgi:hypothetical protein
MRLRSIFLMAEFRIPIFGIQTALAFLNQRLLQPQI